MAAAAIGIVRSTDELTAEWFGATLASAGLLGDAQVERVNISPIGGGALATMVRAELGYSAATSAPESLVVKFPSADPGSLGLAVSMGMYELEVRFYQDVAPLLPDFNMARCFGAAFDPETGMFTLVLEDLSAFAAPQANVAADSDPAEMVASCRRALGALVQFQAPLWDSPRVAKLDWLADNSRAVGLFDAMGQGLVPFLERFGDGLDAQHIDFFKTYLPQAGAWVRSWASPSVLQHGDYRSDNLMIGITPDAPGITVIDFQTVRMGPPGVDAAYLIGSTLPTDLRREEERSLVADWAAGLTAAGVPGFDEDAAWRSYRAGALYGAFLFVGLASQVASSPEIDAFIAAQARRYADMALDLDATDAAGLS